MIIPRWYCALLGWGVLFSIGPALAVAPPIEPAPQAFRQELARHFTAADGAPTGAIQLIECAPGGTTRAFSGGQWYELRDDKWVVNEALRQKEDAKFVFADAAARPMEAPVPWREVRQLVRAKDSIWLVGFNACWQLPAHGEPLKIAWSPEHRIWQLAVASDGRVVMGTSSGLFSLVDFKPKLIRTYDSGGRDWTSADVLGVAFDTTDRLWFSTKAGVGCQFPQATAFYEGRDGLPWNDFTGAAAASDGSVWFTTRLGVIHFDGQDWQYRQGPRWLPNDDVSGAAVDAAGAAWFATAAGIGCLETKPMTLAAKAEFYEKEIERYVMRTPFGYVAEAYLPNAGDKTSADPQDSDNDGLWTSMYGAGESFAYAATRDPRAKERAKKAFDALRFLQKVTQGGDHAPPKGYVARTVRSVTLPDPNIGRLEADREQQRGEPQWKVYEPRWPKSADSQWYWKSDTSSDELDGHYFFYPLYYEFCADTDSEKERVREVVRDLTDHLLTHHYQLTDHDGTHTRWGVFDPASLNLDPNWWAERGLNSLSMLSYLTVASYVTGDAKYADAAQELIGKYGYAQNAMYPKVQAGIGSGNQSDDEMAFMDYYGLLRHTQDATLRKQLLISFFLSWMGEAPEMNPFFNFAYAGSVLNGTAENQNANEVSALNLWPDWQRDAMATLYGFPLDRLNWSSRNSHRLDVIKLPVLNSGDLTTPDSPRRRGLRFNGKVLPVENRYFTHWNTDPWQLDYHGNGNELGAGTAFLLPYYMGLYHGFIEKPQ
jgi:hypothetical protein